MVEQGEVVILDLETEGVLWKRVTPQDLPMG
jgi:hypothetical protein